MSFDFFQFRLIFKYPKALGCWAIWAPNSQVYFHFCKMEILYGIWPPKCPCSRTVISDFQVSQGSRLLGHLGTKFAGLFPFLQNGNPIRNLASKMPLFPHRDIPWISGSRGEHFCQKWRKIRRFIDPDQGANCRRKQGGRFSSTMSTRSYSP